MRKRMKKIKYILLITLLSVGLMVGCDDEKAIPVEQLPAAAQSFVAKTYPGCSIVVAKKDTEWFTTKYKVHLNTGMEIEFDSDGLPMDVDID
jgi:hypothetical protein